MPEIDVIAIDHKRVLTAEEAAFYANYPSGDAWNKAVRKGEVPVKPVPYKRCRIFYDKKAIDTWLDVIAAGKARDDEQVLIERARNGQI